jgi:phosphoribosylformylglycinamidine cyclo-ligase
MDTSATYSSSGVNIDEANAVKKEFAKSLIDKKKSLNKQGAFAEIIDVGLKRYSDPVLVFKSEEPGTKALMGFEQGRVESVCVDMIHHLINDCIMCGAIPVSVQDVVVCGRLESAVVKRIVSAIRNSAIENGCFLSGGETSEQAYTIPAGRYVLSSSIVGVVEKKKIVDGSKVKKGDVVIGLRSSGIHTNGYSLVRKLIQEKPEILGIRVGKTTFGEAIFDIHACYEKTLRPLFKKDFIKGAAHITGGGIKENLNRILPENLDALLDLSLYTPHRIFSVIKQFGEISDEEMLRAYNCGVGVVIVVEKKNLKKVMSSLGSSCEATVLGSVVKGSGKVICSGQIDWNKH